jgi:hypothetical protein
MLAGRLDLNRPALQLLAEQPEFALSGPEAVAAGMASGAAVYDTERRSPSAAGGRRTNAPAPATPSKSRVRPT